MLRSANFLHKFFFLQVNQQKRVRMISSKIVQIKCSGQIYKLCSRNHPILSFRLKREYRQMPITEQLLYQTDKSSHRSFSMKKGVPKNFAIFTRKHLCLSLFLKKLQVVKLTTLLKRDLNTDINIMQFYQHNRTEKG